MVLAGEAGGGGGGEEVKVCVVPWQRQHVQRQGKGRGAAYMTKAEVLPVVELKPFTKKVWRRECSLPTFQPSPGPREEQSTESASSSISSTHPNIARFIHELEEQRRMVLARHSSRSSPRPRGWLHPKTGSRLGGSSPGLHQYALVPSFSSRHHRARASLEDEAGEAEGGRERGPREMEGVGRQSSCLMAAYTRDKPLHQEEVCLLGDRLQTGNTGRRQLAYLNPHPDPQQSFSILQNSPADLSPDLDPDSAHMVPASLLTITAESLPSPNGLPCASDSLPYAKDSSHKRHKPRLALAGNTMRVSRDTWAQQTSALTAGGGSRPGGRAWRNGSPHKFNSKQGAVRDSLAMHCQNGPPTVVERHLTCQQDMRLQRCRRERSLAAVMDFSLLPGSHFVTFDSSPTPGELLLQQARQANRPRDPSKTHKTPTTGRKTGRFWGIVEFGTQGLAVGPSPRPLQCQPEVSRIVTSPGRREEGGLTHRCTGDQTQLKGDASHTTKVWAETVEGAKEEKGQEVDLIESGEIQHRPSSDTALGDSVHVRNEQTAMSADNRARFLLMCLPLDNKAAEDAASQHSLVYDDSHSSVSSLSAAERGQTPQANLATHAERSALPARHTEHGQAKETQHRASSSGTFSYLSASTHPSEGVPTAATHMSDRETPDDVTLAHVTTDPETPVHVTSTNETAKSEAMTSGKPVTAFGQNDPSEEASFLEQRGAHPQPLADSMQASSASATPPCPQAEDRVLPSADLADPALCCRPPAVEQSSGSEQRASLTRPVHSAEVSDGYVTQQPPELGASSTENDSLSPAMCVSDSRAAEAELTDMTSTSKKTKLTDMTGLSEKTEQLAWTRTSYGDQGQRVQPADITRVVSPSGRADSAGHHEPPTSEGEAHGENESGTAAIAIPEPSVPSHHGNEQQLTNTGLPNFTQLTLNDCAADGDDTEPCGDFTPHSAKVSMAVESVEAGDDFEGRETFLTTSAEQPAHKELS